jgi:hypothetical protein
VNLVACFIDAADVLWSVLQNNNKSSCPLDRLQLLMLLKHFILTPRSVCVCDVLSAHLAASSSSLSSIRTQAAVIIWMRGVMLTQAQIKHNSILLLQQSLLFCARVTIYLLCGIAFGCRILTHVSITIMPSTVKNVFAKRYVAKLSNIRLRTWKQKQQSSKFQASIQLLIEILLPSSIKIYFYYIYTGRKILLFYKQNAW